MEATVSHDLGRGLEGLYSACYSECGVGAVSGRLQKVPCLRIRQFSVVSCAYIFCSSEATLASTVSHGLGRGLVGLYSPHYIECGVGAVSGRLKKVLCLSIKQFSIVMYIWVFCSSEATLALTVSHGLDRGALVLFSPHYIECGVGAVSGRLKKVLCLSIKQFSVVPCTYMLCSS